MQIDLREQMISCLRQVMPQARGAWLYGSAARGELMAHSDFDLAVLLPPSQRQDIWMMLDDSQKLTASLGRHVDLVDIQQAPPVLQKEILMTGDCLFSQNPIEIAELEIKAMSQYRDYNERFAMQFAQIAKSGKVLS